MPGDRVLILSVDGGTWRVLEPLAQRGVMAFVREMMAGGRCDLQSTIPPVTAPAWTSYLTCVSPPRHQTYEFQAFDRQERRLKFLPDVCDLPTGWDHLEALGEPYCCVGVPMMYPAGDRQCGVVVCGLDAPGAEAAFSSEQVRRLAGSDYELMLPMQRYGSDASFVRHAAEIEERHAALTLELAGRYPWRIFQHHVQSTDLVQHRLWHRVERCLAQGDTILEDFYRRVDAVLERAYQGCKPDFCVLMSDHGFRPVRKVISLNRWLLDHGYLRQARKVRPWGRLLSLARKLDVLDLRRLILPHRRLWTNILAEAHFSAFDFDRSVGFVANGIVLGHLFVCAGASPVRVAELLRELEGLKDPSSGQQVIQAVLSHQEAFGQPPGRYGPDYFLVPADGYQFCDAALFARWLRAVAPGDVRFGTGGHDMSGIFCVSGGVAVGLTRQPRLMDVFPTVLHLAGLPGMKGVEGRSCVEVAGRGVPGPVELDMATGRKLTRRGRSYSAEQEQTIAGRLRGLGYF